MAKPGFEGVIFMYVRPKKKKKKERNRHHMLNWKVSDSTSFQFRLNITLLKRYDPLNPEM